MSKQFIVDGIHFADKAAYREYMVNTYYSFKNKRGQGNNNGPMIKYPGDINGQPFEISDCDGCSLVVMDVSEQVQIDHISVCKVFIGACSSSVFIRNCTNSIFYICCRQLRIRDCLNCVVYSFTQSEIHIESSNKLRFGPFYGGYNDQHSHFNTAGLSIDKNLWYNVFDHSDPDKKGANWSLLKDYGDPWFPDGSKNIYVPITDPEDKRHLNDSNHQVGESYGLDQLIADNAAKAMSILNNQITAPQSPTVIRRHRNIDADILRIGEEIAMLVVYAEAQGHNLKKILAKDSPNDKEISASSFMKNLLKLTLNISVDADESTRQDLLKATSEDSLKNILELCRDESIDHERGNPIIDVKYFLKLCRKKYEIMTSEMHEQATEDVDYDIIFSLPTQPPSNLSKYSEDFFHGKDHIEPNEVSQSSNEEKLGYPILHTGDDDRSKALIMGDISRNTSKGQISPEKRVPSSPYDEEIKFSDDEEDDVNTQIDPGIVLYDGVASKSTSTVFMPKNGLGDGKSKLNENDFEETLFASSPNSKSIPRRPHSAPRQQRSSSSTQNNSNSASKGKDSKPQMSQFVAFMQNMMEDLLRNTVRQADLYHKIQVHLGFLDSYTMVPPRGEIIVSQPREWLTMRDITQAFEAGRLKLKEFQVQILILLVSKYAESMKSSDRSVFMNSLSSNKSLGSIIVKDGPLLNALWLKKYLASLRLSKSMNQMTNTRSKSESTRQRSSSIPRRRSISNPLQSRSWNRISDTNESAATGSIPVTSSHQLTSPMPWEEWLGSKLLKSKKKRESKPKEFRRALAGLSSSMSTEEMNSMLEKYQIIPENLLQQDIEARVNKWVHDIDGRRDFRHEMNVEIRKYQKKEKKKIQKLSLEIRKEVLGSIKHHLIFTKTEELKQSEKMKQIITKELFWKYVEECKEKGYQMTMKWGDWLRQYLSRQDDAINKARDHMKRQQELTKQELIQNDSVIPFQDIAIAIHSATSVSGLPISNILELKKQFVALRKETARQSYLGDSHGIANTSSLVSKGDFNRWLEPAILPLYPRLPEDVKKLTDQAKMSHDEFLRNSFKNDDSHKFYYNHHDAANRALSLEADLSSKKAEAYNQWLKAKKVEKMKTQQALVSHMVQISSEIFVIYVSCC